jgi:hypothetical protein
VFRIVDTWESDEAATKFYDEPLAPLIEKMIANDPTATPPDRELRYELHDVVS